MSIQFARHVRGFPQKNSEEKTKDIPTIGNK